MAVESQAPPGQPDPRRAQVVQAALSQLGVPYVFGAMSPGKAFDCSGLTAWAYSTVGISLPHSSEQQYNYGVRINQDQLQPADLVFFEGPAPGHVGIYIGGGQVCEAPHTGDVVKTISLQAMSAADGYTGAVSMFTDSPASQLPPGSQIPPTGPDLPQPGPEGSPTMSGLAGAVVVGLVIVVVVALLPLLALLASLGS